MNLKVTFKENLIFRHPPNGNLCLFYLYTKYLPIGLFSFIFIIVFELFYPVILIYILITPAGTKLFSYHSLRSPRHRLYQVGFENGCSK